MMEEKEINARHKEEMIKLKAKHDEDKKNKTEERGLLIVHTGNGKGKTSSAMGMAIRSLGWGMKVGIVQFVKGKWQNGEKLFFTKLYPELLSFDVMGEGFTWETQDRQKDIEAAKKAWERCKELIFDPEYKFLIFDELNIVLRNDTLDINEIVETLKQKPIDKHICITGRGAKPELLEIADLVTDFTEVKHPYHQGIKAQRGVEF